MDRAFGYSVDGATSYRDDGNGILTRGVIGGVVRVIKLARVGMGGELITREVVKWIVEG